MVKQTIQIFARVKPTKTPTSVSILRLCTCSGHPVGFAHVCQLLCNSCSTSICLVPKSCYLHFDFNRPNVIYLKG